jgi:hypothetical protein
MMKDKVKTPAPVNQIVAPGYYFKEILTIKEAAAYIGYPSAVCTSMYITAKYPVISRMRNAHISRNRNWTISC